MAAPLIMAGLSLLPKIPAMWDAVAGLFGKKVPKSVEDAGKLASDVMESFRKGEIPPEVQVNLQKEINRHKERMQELLLEERELELEGKKLEFDGKKLVVSDLMDVRDLEKHAYKVEDEYVRRTRPKILRDFFKLVLGYSLYAPLAIIAAEANGVDGATLTEFITMIKGIGAWLFGTFGTAYIGYTGARMVDKNNPDFKNGKGLLSKAVRMVIK